MSLFGNFFGGGKRTALAQARTVLDLVMLTATLASNPTDIEPMLAEIRTVTLRLQPGEVPSAEDDAILLGVYLKLEAYLTASDPIRTFTKEELRNRLENNMRMRVEAYEAKG